MIWPAWASNPDSPITVARQRVPRRYQQRHRDRRKCNRNKLKNVTNRMCIKTAINARLKKNYCVINAIDSSVFKKILADSVEFLVICLPVLYRCIFRNDIHSLYRMLLNGVTKIFGRGDQIQSRGEGSAKILEVNGIGRVEVSKTNSKKHKYMFP